MARVKFQTSEGEKTVNFSGTPTQADIEEVAQRLNFKPPIQQPVGTQGIGGFALGVSKGALSTGVGASTLGENIIKGIGRFITPKALEPRFGFAKTDQSSAQQLIPQAAYTPEGTAEKLGFGAEQIGEFFIPGAAPLRAGKAAGAAVKGGRLFKGAAKLGAVAGTEAGLAAGQTALQKGEFGPEAGQAAVFGAGVPVAGRIFGKAARGAVDVGAEILGRTTGAGKSTIVEVFKNPNVIRFAREAGSDPEVLLTQTAEQAKSALQNLRVLRGNIYRTQLETLDLGKRDLSSVLDSVKGKITGFKDDLETIVEGENVVNRAIKDVAEWTDTSAAGVDRLKQRLGSYSEQLVGRGKERAKRVVDELRIDAKDGLQKTVPGYTEMTKGYEEASKLIDDVSRSLSLGKRNQIETSMRKFSQTMRRDDDTRKQFLEILSQRGENDLTAQIAGTLLGRATPRGLSTFLSGGAGLGIILNPATATSLIPVMLTTSPRLVGEFVNLLGKIPRSRFAKKAAGLEALPLNIQRSFRQLILQMIEENKEPSQP